MKTILALSRYYNTLDHMIPILWKCQNDFKIHLINTNLETTFLDDPKIKCLRNFEYLDLINVLNPKILIQFYKILNSFDGDKFYWLPRVMLNKIKKLINYLLRKNLLKISSENLLKMINLKTNPDLIIIDYTPGYKEQILLKLLRVSKTKLISVPHAIDNWVNNHVDETDLDPYFRPANRQNDFKTDVYFCPNKNDLNRLKYMMGLRNPNYKMLGSPRFSEEWRVKLEEIYKHEINILKNKYSKKNIVTFFLTKKKHNIFQEEVFRIINYLSNLKEVTILVKPHTWGHQDYKRYFVKQENIEIVDKCSSFALQKISDIIFFSATSVVIDAIAEKKNVYHLHKTVSNKLIYDNYFSTLTVDCREEVFEKVVFYLKNKRKTNIIESEKNKFQKDILFPTKKDVLNIHLSYIKELIGKN